MLVVKIGGSIQKDERDFDLIAEKVSQYSASKKTVVVTSAIKGVTNSLIEATENRDRAVEIVSEMYDRHVKLLSKVAEGPEFESAFKSLSKLADELFRIAWSVKVLDEISMRVRDYILSFGERMASITLGAMLRSRNMDAQAYPEPVLITDDSFGEANVMEDLSMMEVKKLMDIKSRIVVIPGFIGKTPTDRYTTVGRGGSDYTATLVGKLLGFPEVRLITEVPGIMTADPRKFPGAKTISRLSLEEAMELAQMGAKRLHPRTFEPMFDRDLRVYIEGLYDEGYTLVQGTCDSSDKLKGIAVLDDLKLISVESTNIVGKIGSAARVMEKAREAGVNIVSLSQPASETTIHLVVDSKNASKLTSRLQELKDVETVNVQDANAVSVVGCGLRNKDLFKVVLREASSFEVASISRGLRNVSATFVVKKDEGFNLAKDLHEVVVKWIS
ncbi:aspartate kinase [Metallosphaera hakonensis]|uniref:Aspartokinase n=1 Tax=Metallosphaera hakonensis JCM 8857 = DSM 7519 TaxID=1293036 RepID=A0A2U9IVB0_9CREN|nr:aspartate kinase [Metallosphaera hakonensis]AWR99986.1 aspartate kinase [Metallosphaera hakonensis JCM 8857 = DSM 7519]